VTDEELRLLAAGLDDLEVTRERLKAIAAAIFALTVVAATAYLALWSLTH
jgi:hypothetical protein